MAGYILEFRDEVEKEKVLDKLYKAHEAVCDAIKCIEEADEESGQEEGQMNERRRRMSRRDGMSRRGGRMRDERMMREDDMEYRNGRYY